MLLIIIFGSEHLAMLYLHSLIRVYKQLIYMYCKMESDGVYDTIGHTVLPLNVFTKEHRANLPQVIVVHGSFYGVCAGSLLDGQQLEVYFHKETPVITMIRSGKSYIVPVNTTFKFSTLYNPGNDLVKARKGYIFKTVADLLKADPLPKAVYVGKEFTASESGTKRSSMIIQKGQLLILLGIECRFGKARVLKCKTVGDCKEIRMKENCEGLFSTRESLLLFPLPVLLTTFTFPLSTSLYDKDGGNLHSAFKNQSALIHSEISTQQSIIVSAYSSKSITAAASKILTNVMEVYTIFPFNFHIIELCKAEMERLQMKINTLSQSISAKQVTTIVHDVSPSQLQDDLLLPVNNEQWVSDIYGISSYVYEPLPNKDDFGGKESTISILSHVTSEKERGSQSDIKTTDQQKKESSHNVSDFVVGSGLEDLSPPVIPQRASKNSCKPVDAVNDYSSHHSKENQLGHVHGMASMSLEKPAVFPTTTPSVETSIKESFEATHQADLNEMKSKNLDANKRILSNYNTAKMVSLLDKMGLSQYGSKFEEEVIDGRLFFELDDEMLQDELGMVKRIHRIKIMRLIRGEESVSYYVQDK